MDPSKVLSLLEQLDDEIDDLEESLAPLLRTALSETTSKLPLLDKAKLYVLVTYAIESMLFSYLRLNGVDARNHAVFKELTRVKQYFEKIQAAENPVEKRENMTLDKGAAARIIKAGLAGNEKWDEKRANTVAAERAKAHTKFEELSEKMKQDEINKKRKATKPAESSDSDSDSSSESDSDSPPPVAPSKKKHNKSLVSTDSPGVPSSDRSKDSTTKRSNKRARKSKTNTGKAT